ALAVLRRKLQQPAVLDSARMPPRPLALAQDRSRSHLCGIGWIPGLRAVAAGAGAYLLCVPWRERTITAPRSTFVGRPAGTLYLGRVGHVSRQAARHRTDERNDKGAKR